MHFSASHSGDFLLIAIGRNHLGVDLEARRPLPEWEGIARRFFTRRECDWLHQLAPPEQQRGFLQLWVRKEAVVKADGVGLTRPLNEVEVLAEDDDPLSPIEVQGWSLRDLEAPAEYVAALARRPDVEHVVTREWLGWE